MMYASFRNLPKKWCLTWGTFVLFCVLFCTTLALSATPDSGFNTTSKHQFGPDGQGSQIRGPQVGSGMVDAYGNPVFIIEEKKKARLRDSLPQKAQERPLPDAPDTNPLWDF